MSKVDEAVENLIEVLVEEYKTPPKRMVRIDGYVYCGVEGCVHEDTMDPFGYGGNTNCVKSEHRPIFAYTRKWDTPGENL
jgi:hypothetical protein